MKIDFTKGAGLVPAIIQHSETNEVLMLGYMNEESLELTKNSGLVTFFSRS
ncbi:MAG: bifunctional phosphoribosyl-AMP cyclohydrolase/phosphoribosyl-ATP diphosphatase, partial [Hellea sp.]